MFAFLRGIVASKPLGHIELDVNGVGYLVYVPDGVHRKLQVEQEATLVTYCYIREEAFNIYGFLSETDRTLFTTLLSLSGVGPKVALSVLSSMSQADLSRAINDHDVNAFTKISGIGKKGAQRIILEMRAKMGQDTVLDAILGKPESAEDEEIHDDVVEALCALGCTLNEAKKAAQKARKELGDDARDEDVVKAALRSMAKV